MQQGLDVVAAGHGLDHRDVHHPGGPLLAATDLACVDVEMSAQPLPPLVHQGRLAVHHDQRRRAMPGDQGTTHHGLTGPCGCFEHAQVVLGEPGDRLGLPASQLAMESELERGRIGALVSDHEAAAGSGHERGGLIGQPARQMLEILDVAADERGVAWFDSRRFSFLLKAGLGRVAR